MRTIHSDEIKNAIHNLFLDACSNLGDDVKTSLENALEIETSQYGKNILSQLIENLELAREKQRPCCQDTGMAIVFADIGQDIHIQGDSLFSAINDGVKSAYKEGFMRNSVLDPLSRINTGNNTPPVVHYDIVPGDTIALHVAPKGFGSENSSALAMLKPSDGILGVENFIIDRIKNFGAFACPPLVLGVGIGGTMEKAALLSKRQLLRNVGQKSDDPELAELETRLKNKANNLGIGPMGLGGNTTVLAVHADKYPTHLAGLPVALSVQCHACRHKSIVL